MRTKSCSRYMFEDQQVRFVLSRSLRRAMQDEVQNILRWATENRRTLLAPMRLG